jgi:hypothetical protein
MRPSYYLSLFLLLIVVNSNTAAQILNSDYASGADTLILKNEIDIFSTIQEGIRLSIAECELFDSCNANVNREELNQIIDTINIRINTLSIRYSDTPETALEDVLIAYVDVRDQYNELLDKIADMPEFAVDEPVVDFEFEDYLNNASSASPSNTNEVSDEYMDLFEDADEALLDDF